jgi:hypothetical protein
MNGRSPRSVLLQGFRIKKSRYDLLVTGEGLSYLK